MTYCVRCHSQLADEDAFCSRCGMARDPRSVRPPAPAPAPSAPAAPETKPEPPPRRLAVGASIDRGYGRIVVDAKIGSGAMGTVWRAWLFWDPAGPRRHEAPMPLALKQLKPEASAEPAIRAFFENEAEALRLLEHPNVVRFHELFMLDTTVLAMEFVDGDTLEKVIERNVARARASGGAALPGLPFARAWNYVQQLLGALAAAHGLGIVHRDVKPANILIRRDGIVKLADFGIAHMSQPRANGRASNAPSPNEIAPGTGAYMSPEQVLGRSIDGRSDLYCAGIVLYEALAGRPPFLSAGRSELALRMDQVSTPPPSIRAFVPQAPPVLDQLFARVLAKDPAARFANAITMGDAFREALGMPSTPEWRALGQLAEEARHGIPAQGDPRAARMDTLRGIVRHAFQTQPLPAT